MNTGFAYPEAIFVVEGMQVLEYLDWLHDYAGMDDDVGHTQHSMQLSPKTHNFEKSKNILLGLIL